MRRAVTLIVVLTVLCLGLGLWLDLTPVSYTHLGSGGMKNGEDEGTGSTGPGV